MNEHYSHTSAYHTLEEIELRKELLLDDIRKDQATITRLWTSLFRKPEGLKRDATPSKRLGSLVNTGASLLDAFLLGWKLYKKFKPKR